MGYGRFGRGRGFGRGYGFGRGRYFGPICDHRFGMNPLFHGGGSRGIQLTGNSPYSNMLSMKGQDFYPQQSQQIQPRVHQQYPMLGFTHMNCIHHSNGVCTLNNMTVDPNGAACQRFMAR
ncbi:hypothetical protein ACFLQ6_01690 [Thermoproteota archaeon]